ncbi:MAG: hypothetical protein ACR2MB_15800 [Acidimicrobiales bacterium]
MCPASIFTRATRYVTSSAGRTPRENQLTEVTAATRERVPELAHALALLWLYPSNEAAGERASETRDAYEIIRALPADAPVSVRTQVTVTGGFVDLELRLRDPAADNQLAAIVWVEVKHGITAHDEQLKRYAGQRPDVPGAVVLLAPRESLPPPPEQHCADVPERSWQATARRASQLVPADVLADEVKTWLITEWLHYLKEQALMDPETLGPEHLTALAYRKEADAALARICEEAARTIVTEHGPLDDEEPKLGRPAYGLKYWSTVVLPAANPGSWGEASLGWDIFTCPEWVPTGAPGSVMFMAGLSTPKSPVLDATWCEGAQGQRRDGLPVRFEQWTGNEYERFHRVGRPHDVLRGTTLEEQGQSLGRWVNAAFEVSKAQGPPPA